MSFIDSAGEIVHMDEKGLLVVRGDRSQRLFAMTFDKLVGYRGETARELGLRKGRRLHLQGTDDHISEAALQDAG